MESKIRKVLSLFFLFSFPRLLSGKDLAVLLFQPINLCSCLYGLGIDLKLFTWFAGTRWSYSPYYSTWDRGLVCTWKTYIELSSWWILADQSILLLSGFMKYLFCTYRFILFSSPLLLSNGEAKIFDTGWVGYTGRSYFPGFGNPSPQQQIITNNWQSGIF